jgi:hypothetical protein
MPGVTNRLRNGRLALLGVLVVALWACGSVQGLPAWSVDPPPLDGPMVAASAGDFQIRLQVQKEPRAGVPIVLGSTISYVGAADSVTIYSSGAGPVAYTIKQMDGPLKFEAVWPGDCVPHEMQRDEAYWIPYAKSGAFDPGGPNADEYEAFFNDPNLTLKAGEWLIEAHLLLAVDDCGGRNAEALTRLSLTVSH